MWSHGGEVRYAAPGSDIGYDFATISAEIDENTVVVYICNQNNPTAVLEDAAARPSLIQKFSPHYAPATWEGHLTCCHWW